MEIRKVRLKDLNPAPYNPRVDLTPDDPEYQRIAKSLAAFGYVDPLVWNERSGNLVSGHQRLKILLASGVTEEQVSVVDLDPEAERALNLALNNNEGKWDTPRLKDVIEELDTGHFDFDVTGFTQQDLHALFLAGPPEDEGEGGGDNQGGTGHSGCPYWQDDMCCKP